MNAFSLSDSAAHKSIAAFLVLATIAIPVSPVIVLAQEVQNPTEPETSQSTEVPVADVVENTTENADVTQGSGDPAADPEQGEGVDAGAVLEEDASAPPASQSLLADPVPEITNQSTLTAQTVPKSDMQSGALTQRIQLSIPPGRKGLQPDIALEYNSQNTQDGIAGYGWSVSIPYIQRLNKTGLEKMYDADGYFSSSMDGELATTSTSTFRAKFNDGSYRTYTYDGSGWTMYDKNGTRYLFGTSSQARQASTSPSRAYKWMLEEIRDTNDNYVKFVYSTDSGELYPYQIIYTGSGVSDGLLKIEFATSTRPDVITSFRQGFQVVTKYRISTITASVSGSWVKKYELSYSSGSNTKRSMLAGVREVGRDESGIEASVGSTTFGYVSTTTKFADFNSFQEISTPLRFISDVQGNAVNDATLFSYDTCIPGNNGSIVADNSSYGPIVPIPLYWATNSCSGSYVTSYEQGARFIDVNADGKADAIRSQWDYTAATSTVSYNLNSYSTSTGYAWVATTTAGTTIPPFFYTGSGSTNGATGFFGELNGDGLPDYLFAFIGYTDKAYFGDGVGWTPGTTTLFTPRGHLPQGGSNPIHNSQLIDINGDGLDDWLASDATSTYFHLNTGSGWNAARDARWDIPTSTYQMVSGAMNDRGIRFADINGDGLPDFIRSYSITSAGFGFEVATTSTVYLNTGAGWATSTSYVAPSYIMYESGGTIRWNEIGAWKGNGQQYQDVLETITYPQGGTTTVMYKPTALHGTHPELPTSLLTVTKIRTSDGIGLPFETNYTYEGGKMYLASGVREKKFGGFSMVSAQDTSSLRRSYFHRGDNTDTANGEQNEGFALVNRPYREDVLDPFTLSPLQRTYKRWDTIVQGNSTFVGLGRLLVQDYASDGSHIDKGVAFTYATSGSNLTKKIEYGLVTGSSNGTFTDVGTDARTTEILYAASSAVNMFVPVQATTTNYAGVRVKESKTYFDSLGFGSLGKGNATKQENWISGTTYASTTQTFNSYGLPTQSKDARGNTTTYIYDPYNFFVATTTNALSQTVGYVYDYSLGKPKLKTDENNRTFQTVFDGLDRVTQEKQPDTTAPTSYVILQQNTYTDTPGAVSVLRTKNLNAATSTSVYEYFDGIGRKIQTRAATEVAGPMR